MSCPLTLTYLTEIDKNMKVSDLTSVIWGTHLEHIDSLEERARDVQGSMEYQRLRAFWCVEMMYSTLTQKALCSDHLLRKYAGATTGLVPLVVQRTVQLPRSWEGLGILIDNIEALDGELSIQLTEITFAKNTIGNNEVVLLENRFKTTMKVFEANIEAAKLLRRSLGNDDLPIHTIGKSFAFVLDTLRVPHQQRVDYGITLLNISPDNSLTPW